MPFRRAACWGSARRVPLWPRMEAVGAPKKGLRALCCPVHQLAGLGTRTVFMFHQSFTHGDLDGFMVAPSYRTPGPVVEAPHCSPDHVFRKLIIFQVMDPRRDVLCGHGYGYCGLFE